MFSYKLGDKIKIQTTSALLCRPNTVIINKVGEKRKVTERSVCV